MSAGEDTFSENYNWLKPGAAKITRENYHNLVDNIDEKVGEKANFDGGGSDNLVNYQLINSNEGRIGDVTEQNGSLMVLTGSDDTNYTGRALTLQNLDDSIGNGEGRANLHWMSNSGEPMCTLVAHPLDDHFSLYTADGKFENNDTNLGLQKRLDVEFGSENVPVIWSNVDKWSVLAADAGGTASDFILDMGDPIGTGDPVFIGSHGIYSGSSSSTLDLATGIEAGGTRIDHYDHENNRVFRVGRNPDFGWVLADDSTGRHRIEVPHTGDGETYVSFQGDSGGLFALEESAAPGSFDVSLRKDSDRASLYHSSPNRRFGFGTGGREDDLEVLEGGGVVVNNGGIEDTQDGGGITVTSPDGSTTKEIGIDNDGNLVARDP